MNLESNGLSKQDSDSTTYRTACGCLGSGCLYLFFGPILLIGGLFFLFSFLFPAGQVIRARSWVETPCTVISSEVKSDDAGDSTTYSVDIKYEYEVSGQRYQSDRYKFFVVATNNFSGTQSIVDLYPAGSQQKCYVNPADPSEAVIERGATADLFFGLIPLAFIIIGLVGVGWGPRLLRGFFNSVRLVSESSQGAQAWLPQANYGVDLPASSDAAWPTQRRDDSASVTLQPTLTPTSNLLIAVGVGFFWNSVVSVFVVMAINSWRQGKPEWLMMAFISPFVLIGLALMGYIGYSILAIFNLTPTLTLNRQQLALGDTVEIGWHLRGNTNSLRRLHIFLLGQEEARYRRGTSNYTDREKFAEITIVDISGAFQIADGKAEFTIPGDSIHSFAARHNSIVWTIELRGEVNMWPDVHQSCRLVIEPHRRSLEENHESLDD